MAVQDYILEDLFVRTQFRGKGIGKTLLAHSTYRKQRALLRRALEVLDWTSPL